MNFSVRLINGTLGSAIAISNGAGEEHKLAIFADARIQDFAPIGADRCVLISHKRGVAVVDLSSRKVIKRGHLPRPYDRIAVAKDCARALVYHCNPGLIAFIELASLIMTAEFNLLQLREDGAFDLLYRDPETLREEKKPWDCIPFSDGPLRSEVREDEIWLKYAPEEPSGLRRMRFTRSARAEFRADGKVVVPFEFGVNGPNWLTDRGYEKPITASARVITVGIAVIDEGAARAELRVVRQQTEASFYTMFPIRSISADGTRAILQSFDPVAHPTEVDVPVSGGILRKIFGRRASGKLAFGFEQWDIAHEPKLETTVAFKSLDGDSLLPVDTQHFNDGQLQEARKEIDMVFPGIEAGFYDRQKQWLSSQTKRDADAYFDPLETRKAPAYNPAFNRCHYPPLFAEVMQRLVKLNSKPFSHVPWARMGDRQSRLLSALLSGWSQHSAHAVDSIVWMGIDRFIMFARDGKVREVSTSGEVGHTYQLIDPEKKAWPFSNRNVFPPDLQHVKDRIYAIDLLNIRLEFELPSFSPDGSGDFQRVTPLYYRQTIDGARHTDEVKQVDRLTEKIRRGYVKIGVKDGNNVITGLHELTKEVQDHLDEIVVDNRWIPTLYHRGKPVTEAELCDILSADGSEQAVRALDGLLTAFLDATEGQKENIWHPDDETPTMGPVSLALIKLCDPLPPSIARFYGRRDMDHDMWTFEAFERLELPQKRLLAADLVTLQVRLAIQDICTGNVDKNIFALYQLKLVRDALDANTFLVADFAEMIVEQTKAQAPDFTWASSSGVSGILKAIVESLDTSVRSEAHLASELLHRAELRQA
jgi:hypothetical protein